MTALIVVVAAATLGTWAFTCAVGSGKGATMHWTRYSLLILGGAAALLALAAWIGDHCRSKRNDLDRVGVVPWTDVFFWSTMATVLLLGLGAREVF